MTQSKTFEEFWNNPETIALRKKMNNKHLIELRKFYPATVKIPVTVINSEHKVQVKIVWTTN